MSKLRKKFLVLILIILIGSVLRLYYILDFPVQLNHDEVSQLYDAISIAQTQRDIYGNLLPTIFYSVQDYKSPFYTYITSLFYLFLGGGELTIRLPGVIFGILTILAVYLFTLKLFKNWNISVISAFFTAIAPFEIFFSRKSFENGAGIFFILMGFTSLLTYINRKNRTKHLFIAAILLGIAVYTYFSHAILIPLILLAFVIIYREHFLADFKQVAAPLILLIVFLTPLVILILTNPSTRFRSKDVFITQDINLGRNIEHAKSANFLNSIFTESKAVVDFSFNRYLSQFDIMYIFGNGLDFTNQGPLGQGLLLFVQLPFLILGIIYLVKLKDFKQEKVFLLTWILLGMLPSGLTFEPHSPHRSIMVFTMLNIISAVGIFSIFKYLNSLDKSAFKLTLPVILILVFSINYLYFLHMYFVNFPYEKSQEIHYPVKQVAKFAWSEYDNFDQIIFDPVFGATVPIIGTAAHYYLAYYGNYPPAKFQKEYRKGEKEREILFDKFSIRKIDWRDDQYLKKVLIIGSPWSLPIQSIDKNKILKTFYFYNGQPAFYAVKL